MIVDCNQDQASPNSHSAVIVFSGLIIGFSTSVNVIPQ